MFIHVVSSGSSRYSIVAAKQLAYRSYHKSLGNIFVKKNLA
jgi:hypothetical protein